MIERYFSPQIFVIILRETLESAIIISVLLAFIAQSFESHEEDIQRQQEKDLLRRKLTLQVWTGGFCGLALCLLIGGVFIMIFHIIGMDLWSLTEHYWEGAFSILASIILSVMGLAMLRINKLKEKWRSKLVYLLKHQSFAESPASHSRSRFIDFGAQYSMFILPFVTTLREGMEAVVFIGGVGVNEDMRTIPLSLLIGLLVGVSVGFLFYKSGNTMPLRIFLIASTCLLYLVAAGLLSKGVWQFELQRYIINCHGQDMSEVGSGPGSYDISQSVWHVNCCNGERDQGWVVFTAILGWTNSATYGSVISYNLYWAVLIVVLAMLIYEEKYGYLPLVPMSFQSKRIMKNKQTLSESMNQAARASMDSNTPLIHN